VAAIYESKINRILPRYKGLKSYPKYLVTQYPYQKIKFLIAN